MDERYKEYLQSDWWKKTRSECILRAGNKCECCGKPFDLQAHHLTYEHIGFERDYELMCLCSKCHEWIEARKQEAKQWGRTYDAQAQKIMLLQRAHSLSNNEEYSFKPSKDIIKEFIKEYEPRDYSRNGLLNMTHLDVIKEEFRRFCLRNSYDPETPLRCTTIQDYFRNRRYEVILKYMENGAEPYIVIQQTRIRPSMIYKVFHNPKQARMMLEREEKYNAETSRI